MRKWRETQIDRERVGKRYRFMVGGYRLVVRYKEKVRGMERESTERRREERVDKRRDIMKKIYIYIV